VPSGFTRDFLDGKIKAGSLSSKIEKSFAALQAKNDFLVVEGTGHCGVGSIINLNNAQVAALLNLPVLLLASGGLGSAFDELSLNKAVCDQYGVRILGVLLNRVLPEKKEMVQHYMAQALKRWDLPLLGCIPFDPFLSYPTMKDFEMLFQTELVTGQKHRLRHFKNTRLVATSVETYREVILKSQLIITPSNREDIILATLTKHWDYKIGHPHDDLEAGMILTGDYPPRHYIVEELKKADIPMIYIPVHSHTAMQMITSYTSKIRNDDVEKVREAIAIAESHIDFNLFERLL
jgi:phosphate acetyltransferase